MSGQRFRYKAFISYSHRDTHIAQWLHRALESYRAPRHLIGQATATGTIEKRLGAIFRDRDELPVAADLTGQINDALSATQFLIVLCSTASSQSKWVNQEVINFKRMKGAGSIIAVIVDGEPYASAMPEREAEECFVPALRFQVTDDGHITDQPAEPIAADLRPGKDGKRMVKMKVLAGLLGVGLDALVQRETQRRQRLMTAVTFASLAGIGIMGALTFNAIEARNDAQFKRTQAEGLIEFMLGDLRQKLQPVGRLEVLDSVGERSLQYFSTLKSEELDADTLGRRARALHLIGEIRDLRGNTDLALESFKEASETTAEMLARQPVNPQRLFDHAQSEYWMGYLNFRKGNLEAAEPYFKNYLNLASRLVATEPSSVKWRTERAHAYNNLGIVAYKRDQIDDAITALLLAKDDFANVTEASNYDEASSLNLAQTLAWLADAQRKNGQFEIARNLRNEEVTIYNRLRQSDPQNKSVAQALLISYRSLGHLDFAVSKRDEAARHYDAALKIAESLMELDDTNLLWLDLTARLHVDLAELSLSYKDDGAARTHLDRVQEFSVLLESPDRKTPARSFEISAKAAFFLALLNRKKKPSDSLRRIDIAIALLQGLRRSGSPNEGIDVFTARALLLRGTLLHDLRRENDAEAAWTEGLDIIGKTNDKLFSPVLMAQLHRRLGRASEAEHLLLQVCRHDVLWPDLNDVCSSGETKRASTQK